MTDFEQFLWALTYAAGTVAQHHNPQRTADMAVTCFHQSQEMFENGNPNPPAQYEDEDFPF